MPGSTGAGGLSIKASASGPWTTFTTQNGLGSNIVSSVCASTDGQNIYAATAGGLSIGDNAGTHWTNHVLDTSSPSVVNVAITSDAGIIYAVTESSLFVSDSGGNNWQQYTVADGLTDLVNNVKVSSDGQIIYVLAPNGAISATFDGLSFSSTKKKH